jgi:aminopeptidase N
VLVLTEAEQTFTFVNVEAHAGAVAAARLLGAGGAGRRPGRCRAAGAAGSTTATPSTAGRPASAWRWAACWPRCRAMTALPPLDDAFLQAMRRVLRDPALDPAFKDLVLTLPSEAYVAECSWEATSTRSASTAVREQMRRQMAAALHDDWVWAFEPTRCGPATGPPPHRPAARAGQPGPGHAGAAAVTQGDAVWPGRAYQRFKDAGNMTDRFGALVALVDAQSPLAEPALARFHALFR